MVNFIYFFILNAEQYWCYLHSAALCYHWFCLYLHILHARGEGINLMCFITISNQSTSIYVQLNVIKNKIQLFCPSSNEHLFLNSREVISQVSSHPTWKFTIDFTANNITHPCEHLSLFRLLIRRSYCKMNLGLNLNSSLILQ